MGSIEIIIGIISLHTTLLIAQIIPKIANIYYMFRLAKFSRTNYIIRVDSISILSICLCILGVISILGSFFIKDKNDNTIHNDIK